MSDPMKCSCLCGSVEFKATPKAMTMDACHCEMCSKWAGGVFLSVACSDVDLDTRERLTIFASSEHAERVSCSTCGATLIWRMKDLSFQSVSVHAFEHPADFRFDRELFIDAKPASYAMSMSSRQLTEAQISGAPASEESAQ